MLHIFGESGFLSRATNHSRLRGYVLDTKFAPQYDVTHVLTTIRQDISAEKWVEGMTSLPRLHTSCSSKVESTAGSQPAKRPRISSTIGKGVKGMRNAGGTTVAVAVGVASVARELGFLEQWSQAGEGYEDWSEGGGLSYSQRSDM